MVHLVFAILLLWPNIAQASEERLFYIAPSQIIGVERQMNTAGYWISQHPSPDQIILSDEEIIKFNARIQDELKLTKDIFSATDQFKTETLMVDFGNTLKSYREKGYYTADGGRNDSVFMDDLRRRMNLPGVVIGVNPRYGLVVHYTDMRFFPTQQGLYEAVGDVDFDQIQNSTLDVGSAVAVVHQSLDKKWYYCFSATADGWVRADDIALGEAKSIQEYVQQKSFITVIKPKADIFLNEAMTSFHDAVRMGVRFVFVSQIGNKVSALVPVMDADHKLQIVQGYLNSNDVHIGYLPYTMRNVYRQAFAMLNQPYGWGGMRGEQDCSAFLDEVFGTMGIILPRDSKDQALVGQSLAEFDAKTEHAQKLLALKQVVLGAIILPMKGHIMLYLGMLEEKPYAIHAIWAYRERKNDKDVPRVLNRVVVSDLSLGEGSKKGSLLRRLSKIIEVK